MQEKIMTEVYGKGGRVIVRELNKGMGKYVSVYEVDKVIMDESVVCTSPIEVGLTTVIKCKRKKDEK